MFDFVDEKWVFSDTERIWTPVRTKNAHNTQHRERKALCFFYAKNKEIQWFAHRFNEDGTVYEAEIDTVHRDTG